MLLNLTVVVDKVDKEAFGIEQVDDCLRDMYLRPLHARVGVVDAAYLADLVIFVEV